MGGKSRVGKRRWLGRASYVALRGRGESGDVRERSEDERGGVGQERREEIAACGMR